MSCLLLNDLVSVFKTQFDTEIVLLSTKCVAILCHTVGSILTCIPSGDSVTCDDLGYDLP